MSDSGGTQQPWSPGGQPTGGPGWGQQPTQGPPPSGGYGPPPGAAPSPPPGPTPGAYGAWGTPQAAAPSGGLKGEATAHPWLLGSAALLVTFVIVLIGDIINTFQKQSGVAKHPDVFSLLALKVNGLQGRDRVLQFFDWAQPAWALLLLVAVALLVFGPKITGAGESATTRRLLLEVVLFAGAATALGGVVDAIIYVTYFGESFTLGLHGFLQSLGGGVIGLSAGYWALGNRVKSAGRGAAPPPPPWGPSGGAPSTTGFQPGQYPAQGGYPPPGGYGPPGS